MFTCPVIKEVMMEREAVWLSSSGPASAAPAPEPANPASSAARQAAVEQRANAPPLPKVINQLRDGTPLCPDFQRERCSTRGRQCPQGQHRCGRLLKGGRVCGSYQHAGHKCNARNRELKVGQPQGAGVSAAQTPSQKPLFRSHLIWANFSAFKQ